jgi:hypothetical protein
MKTLANGCDPSRFMIIIITRRKFMVAPSGIARPSSRETPGTLNLAL